MTAPIKWAEAGSPIYWSNIGINWNTPAKDDSVTYSVSIGLDELAGYRLYEEAHIKVVMNYTSRMSFLWEPIPDPDNNWTPVDDPSSIWTEKPDTSSIWTKRFYPE